MSIYATFIGRLGRDPETRSLPSGQSVTDINMAVNHGFGDKQTTTWVRCAIWGKPGETVAQHTAKGSQLLVCGELYEESYTGRDGQPGKSLRMDVRSFEFVGKREDNQAPQQKSAPKPPAPKPASFEDFDDDSIPF